jgi:hypothetical protein
MTKIRDYHKGVEARNGSQARKSHAFATSLGQVRDTCKKWLLGRDVYLLPTDSLSLFHASNTAGNVLSKAFSAS